MHKKEQLEIFDSWIRQHKPLLFKVVRAYAFDPENQNDLFQEVSIQIWLSIPNFRKESKVSTWLYRIALNVALNWTRKNKRHSNGRQTLDGLEKILEQNKEPIDERLEWLYHEISKLNKIDRSITLLMLDGFSYKEMAEILGISESNIGVKIHRIKNHLSDQMKKKEHYGL
ncbi:MAG TPA: RNA polymerase subunit sigma-70 [Balneola sp.]|jgi:RNA polymerase sigma-70 factor (ECF subfamily)|nr:RNA polymerase subunit sigma-70 [Bacteroidota bacterium]MAC06173.1 RNA polymerase subunit sigma-70 [Balneola sp.]MAO78529.1 RNA polymerase subunit sigma-70 [Balneola sp.]MBF64894.1 RNA polymerase subunit sigma-70 [Balneola sp.]HAH50701.1 RNA polymerase subunit sigma-70 [Balneola sp.]|tara:strand:- start:16203 stop:16715 length:513 start_codon:yes stop_codon:yes gene_type:complete